MAAKKTRGKTPVAKKGRKKGRWSRADVAWLTENYVHMGDEQLAKALGRSKESVILKMEELELGRVDPEVLATTVAQDQKIFRARLDKRTTTKKYRRLAADYEELQAKLDAVVQLRQTPQTMTIRPSKAGTTEATAVISASDWHVDETVNPATVSGLNEFDPDIAIARGKKFFSNSTKLVRNAQRDARIKTIVMALLGDFISNTIHEELQENNSMLPAEAIWFVQNMLISGINFLLNHSKCDLVIVCNVGNHSRMTKRVHYSTEQGNSLERYMYYNLALHFRGEKRVEFIIADGYHTYMDVYGYMLRFHHGHAIRYGGGVGGITIPVNKAIAQWNKARRADVDVFAHFHQYHNMANFVCNGSLIGFNAYALNIKASYEPPQQNFFLVHRGKGKGLSAPIWLE
ncbi:hypothetical protein HOB10_03430 [Candidatus Parcubacteria bacterium]|jgi:hypothetical protein|nr:hypothetical protein [Candidatus Parcubacteria bacterium]